MNVLITAVLFSSFSFLGYVMAYFKYPKMKEEFKRFGLEKAGTATVVFELLGALGLLVGLKFKPVLLLAAAGLTILMLLGVAVRIKVKDNLWVSLPALFFMLLNAYIFYTAYHLK